MTASERRPGSGLLVIVHPGSACGSADFNLQRGPAREARARMVAEIDAWSGDICVIDGLGSEELSERRFSALNFAIRHALRRNREAGFTTGRRWGSDSNMDSDHRHATRRLIRDRKLVPASTEVVLTGAWYDPHDIAGCVNDVRKEFETRGFSARVMGGTMTMKMNWREEFGLAEATASGAAPAI
jgi:hypothetical protein